jgi:F-type H+-transporting ATPase subunit gamma
MEMVATQKLKRLQARADAARPFSSKIQEMVARLAGSVSPELSPLLGEREVKTTANLVITSDKGLCGGYNANMVRFTLETLADDEGRGDQRLLVLGRKGDTMLRARKRRVDTLYEDVVEKIDFTRVRSMVRELATDFLEGRIDRLRILYTAFLSAARQKPVAVTILPVRPDELVAEAREGAEGASLPGTGDVDFIIEPSADELLRDLVPKFLEIKVYAAVLQALASEYTYKRNAMKQATDAADDMIGALKRQYNRARQESITKELLEVASGAEALK